jgi:hypothetical protein
MKPHAIEALRAAVAGLAEAAAVLEHESDLAAIRAATTRRAAKEAHSRWIAAAKELEILEEVYAAH